jgi:hypothetical protein
MAYNWPDGWNESRLEKAVQGFVCDTLGEPKKSVRAQLEKPVWRVDIFAPLTPKPTADVHEVFGRLSGIPPDNAALTVGYMKEKVKANTYRLQTINVWSPTWDELVAQ